MAMENSIKNAQKLKIILLGDSGVGKTSLINQYVNKGFQKKPILHYQAPLSKQIEVNNKPVTLEIHDTDGREREGAAGLEVTFFSDAKGCMLVYDVNDPKSLDNLENWHNEFITRVFSNRASSISFPFIVLGNKADTDAGRNKEVYPETARKLCQREGITHMLTSAKDNKSVVEAFLHVAQLALNYNTPQSLPSTQNGAPPITKPTAPAHNSTSSKPSSVFETNTDNNPKPPPRPQYNNNNNNNNPKPPQSNTNPKPPAPTQFNSISKPPQSNNNPKPPLYNNNHGKPPPPKNNSCCTIL